MRLKTRTHRFKDTRQWLTFPFCFGLALFNEQTLRWRLLDEGFERSQFSVYARFVNGKEGFATRVRRIEQNLPSWGDVQILNFTDRQYRDIVHFSDQGQRPKRKNPDQLVLFWCDSFRKLTIDQQIILVLSKNYLLIDCSISEIEVQLQLHVLQHREWLNWGRVR